MTQSMPPWMAVHLPQLRLEEWSIAHGPPLRRLRNAHSSGTIAPTMKFIYVIEASTAT
ncbi:hypothetical protein [Methylibium rhizosphaerae]|uniref:hypothetical protein n=1 Tax=Methylibium rhizosphaerae TaxID=2570323 RepID=UPI0015E43088|nr:hypothetical protein [Methylibium rhizosphaerae]